jgi:glyoxylate reductase
MTKRIVVSQPLLFDATDRLLGEGYTVDRVSDDGPPPANELRERVRGAAGLVCLLNDNVDANVLRAGAPTLKVVSNVAVGVDNIDLDEAARLGITVCNTPGVLDAATADLAMALLLAVCRKVVAGSDLLRRGGWTGFALESSLGRDLAGMRLGLVGYGRIARRVEPRARSFEMVVHHHARHDTGLPGYVADLDELLGSSDAVSLHVPLTDETHHLLDAHRLSLLPPGAVVVNTARGAVIDEEALADALGRGQLGGAGLDVFVGEPNVNPRLLVAPNLVLTPHIGSATVETRSSMCEMAVNAVVEVLAGRPYEHVVHGTTIAQED